MDENQLISELEQVAHQEDDELQVRRAQLIQEVELRAYTYQQSNQHWQGISLLMRAREIIAPLTDLDRTMALLLGGKAELVMRWAGGLRISPPVDLLSLVEADLREAINVDPTLADPYWDLAVINARYRADYATAARYLADAMARGYGHPMMAGLEAMIKARPPLDVAPDTDETRLRQLILRLAVQAAGPTYGSLVHEKESTDAQDMPRTPWTFGDYIREARAIAAKRSLSEDQYSQILEDSRVITSDSSEFIVDLLRRVAEFVGEQPFLDQVTDVHLRIIRDFAFDSFGKRAEDAASHRRSRRAAERGLEIIKGSRATIDSDLHADLLIAKGQALYYEDKRHATEAIPCYHSALRLKRQANNAADVEKMKGILWRQIDHRVGQAIFSLHIGGIGEALEILKVCAEVADDLENLPRAMAVKVHLASVLRQVGQYHRAEEILHEVMEGLPPEKIARDVQFEFAAVYSETFRPREAMVIQKKLLDEGGMDDDQTTAVLWANYSNVLRLLKDFEGARTALEKAWELLPPEQKQKIAQTIPHRGGWIKTLLAQIDLEMDNPAEALQHIQAAEALNSTPVGIDGLHFYALKARCLTASGQSAQARQYLDTAIHNLGYLLSYGPSLPSWESLLHHWAPLDVMAVRAHLDSGVESRFENALLRAEAAKGRVCAWLERWAAPKGAEQALALDRQVQALEKAREWLRERPQRRIVSLFGADDGLGVFDVDASGEVTGVWLEDFNYDLFRKDIYEPWERLVERALNEGHSETLALAGSLTDYLLDSIGTWLWRARPILAEGGTDLVILPYRLFRSLPLAHARLPTGSRLSDLFDTVVIMPSLADLGRGLEAAADNVSQPEVTALANADNSLPFAQCEAILSGAGENLLTGSAVTTEAVRGAFEREGIFLLSLHGDFDEQSPFHSKMFTADGDLPLHRLLLGQTPIHSRIVVLGVCEAGRSSRSLSDEPLGFPAMLLQAGVAVVLSPVWRVDDFASFLFISKLFNAIDRGMDFFHAVGETSRWLRDISAEAVLQQTDELIGKVMASGEQGQMAVAALKPQLDVQRAWIETLNPTQRPFRSPLDWTAFQITGIPPVGAGASETK